MFRHPLSAIRYPLSAIRYPLIRLQPLKEPLRETNLQFLAGHDVGEVVPGFADGSRDSLLDGQGRPRARDDVLCGMDDQ
jgi:hypothetical protein